MRVIQPSEPKGNMFSIIMKVVFSMLLTVWMWTMCGVCFYAILCGTWFTYMCYGFCASIVLWFYVMFKLWVQKKL